MWILDVLALCSARYVFSHRTSQEVWISCLKNYLFQNIDLFHIFPFSISYLDCQVSKMFSNDIKVCANGKSLIIDEKYLRNDDC